MFLLIHHLTFLVDSSEHLIPLQLLFHTQEAFIGEGGNTDTAFEKSYTKTKAAFSLSVLILCLSLTVSSLDQGRLQKTNRIGI